MSDQIKKAKVTLYNDKKVVKSAIVELDKVKEVSLITYEGEDYMYTGPFTSGAIPELHFSLVASRVNLSDLID